MGVLKQLLYYPCKEEQFLFFFFFLGGGGGEFLSKYYTILGRTFSSFFLGGGGGGRVLEQLVDAGFFHTAMTFSAQTAWPTHPLLPRILLKAMAAALPLYQDARRVYGLGVRV